MKKLNKKQLYVGMLVVVTDSPETQVYTVEQIDEDYFVHLTWYVGTNQGARAVDYSILQRPTIQQIEYSINANGKLANVMDVVDLKFVMG
jgi:hypothetical protein